MSEDLIRRSDAIKAVRECVPIKQDADEIVDKITAIEPKRGEWKIEDAENAWGKGYMLTCSECGDTFRVTENALPHEHFCRNCGADMRGKDDE